MLNFVKRFASFKKPVSEIKVVTLKTSSSEEGICNLVEEDTPPISLTPADPDEEDFALSMQPASPGASTPFGFDFREYLQSKLPLVPDKHKESALQGLSLLALSKNVTLAKAVFACEGADQVLTLLPESLLHKAADLIESLIPMSTRLIAFPEPTQEEEASGDLNAYKRRACFEISHASALVGTGYCVVRRETLHKALMGSE